MKPNSAGGRGRIKTLLDGALSAGKAARNEAVVPEIRRLKEYGSDGTPPSALASVVAQVSVHELRITVSLVSLVRTKLCMIPHARCPLMESNIGCHPPGGRAVRGGVRGEAPRDGRG